MVRGQRQAPPDEWDSLRATGQSALADDDLVQAVRTRSSQSNCPDRSAPDVHRRLEGLYCLRDRDHPGRHIALGLGGVMAAWPGRHRPTLADLEQ